MKSKNRFYKAIAIIFILGIGVLNNIRTSYTNHTGVDRLLLQSSETTNEHDENNPEKGQLKITKSTIIYTAIKYLVQNH